MICLENPPRIPLFQRGKTNDLFIRNNVRENAVQNKYRFWTRMEKHKVEATQIEF